MRSLSWLFTLAAAAVLAGVASTGHAETTQCTAISTLPFVITSPGIYCLTGNLNTVSGAPAAGIEVHADNVVIDLNGHVLSNTHLGRTPTQARGIHSYHHRDITIRNGTIRGFHTGVLLEETYPANYNRTHIVEDLKIENCRVMGMWIIGQSSTVRRNVVRDTGSDAGTLIGINVVGQGSQVLDNLVHNVGQGVDAVTIGIAVGDHDVMVVNNRVSGAGQGIVFDQFDTSGAYRDNLTSGVGTPYVTNGNAVDAGNNH